MFNLQGSEVIIVLLLALVVLGPEKLPDAMRKAGKAYAELKKMSTGFQSEFRSAVDEPLREIRETANMLRDSADFTKLQTGERAEKPKSAEMAPVDPDAVPVDAIPSFETPGESGDGPTRSADSEPAPFADEPSEPRVIPPSEPITSHPPFTGMSSSTPTDRPVPDSPAAESGGDDGHDGADGEPGTDA